MAFESLTNQLQPPALKLHQQGYPLIRFREDYSTESHTNEALHLQQADLAIDTIEHRDSSLICEPFATEEIVLICRQGHPRITGEISVDQYFKEQHITLTLTRANLSALGFYAMENVSGRIVVAECHSLLSQIGLVAQGDCVGACSKVLALKYQHVFNIQVIKMPLALKPIQLSLIWHRRHKNNPAHIWLRDTIKAIFKETSIK